MFILDYLKLSIMWLRNILNMYTGTEIMAVNETRGATQKVVMDVNDPILDRGHIV